MLVLLLAIALVLAVGGLVVVNLRLAQKRDDELARAAANRAIGEALDRLQARR